ncbi:MAG: hypothetical protein NC396_01350 [Bacteroides sp.]|nr:hypothetical protein [Bacteroides sp.]MCM1085485.1 hypothetical protein [Bacteroides sp.]
MQKSALFQRSFLFLSLLLSFHPGLRAQDDEVRKNAFSQRIEAIKTSPLEVLPASDCRLADLESEIFLSYARQNSGIPSDLRHRMQEKRRQIDFMRSRIDSLYYIQALQAINQSVPDWKEAERNIGKSLLHNRFFIKAIAFRLTCLSLDKTKEEALLQYVNQVLRECSYPPKIRQMAQTVYGRTLKEIEELISRKLYRDALDLCRLLETYFLPEFPVSYMRYKEKLLQNKAHQGVYRSFCEVAEKAFSQKQYQFAQQYALQAYDYFNANEKHMDGLNRVLELLDRIALEYNRIASLSDIEERAFYSALVDTIVNRTGLVISPRIEYRPEDDLALELELLNRSLHPDTIPQGRDLAVADSRPLPQRTPIQPAAPDNIAQTRLSPQQARRQFETDCEQARYLNTKRKFPEAYAWFEEAVQLKNLYRLRAEADFEQECLHTLYQAIDQLLNRALFQLWNNNGGRADSLYVQSSALFGRYREQNPEEVAALTPLQQLLDNYQQKRNDIRCRQWSDQLNRIRAAFFREASFGNYASAEENLLLFNRTFNQWKDGFADCADPEARQEKIRSVFADWTSYRQSMEEAFACHRNGDTVAFIAKYLSASAMFDTMGLSAYVPAEPSLFGRLSACGDLQSLLVWDEYCLRGKEWKQARFLTDYLLQQDYRRKYVEKLARQLKKVHE